MEGAINKTHAVNNCAGETGDPHHPRTVCASNRVQLKMRAALPGTSISVVSEPRAVATGSYAQLSINTYFVRYFLIRSLPLAVLTRFVATLTFNYTHRGFGVSSSP